MRDEVGSFFEEDRNSGQESRWLEELMGRRNVLYTSSGREAIELAILETERLCPNVRKVCLLPQYTCDTVIRPFQKRGWELYFYPMNEQLSVCETDFSELLERIKPQVLLMHTYFGRDTIRKVRKLIAYWQKKKGLIFIEDMTQSLGLLPKVRGADYYVGSLRKWFAIPDGGFLIGENLPHTAQLPEKTVFVEKKRMAQHLKAEYLNETLDISKTEFLRINAEAERCLEQDDTICRMSQLSLRSLHQMDGERQLLQRQRNGRVLSECMKACRMIRPLGEMGERIPLYIPILAENRDALQRFLQERDIFAPVLWEIPQALGTSLAAEVQYVFDHMLALPCDQRYTEQDMVRVGEALVSYENYKE